MHRPLRLLPSAGSLGSKAIGKDVVEPREVNANSSVMCVGGTSRSGTTIYAGVLAESLGFSALPELHFFNELIPKLGLSLARSSRASVADTVAVLGTTASTQASIGADFLDVVRSASLGPSCRAPLEIPELYVATCETLAAILGASGVVEKTPLNLRFWQLIARVEHARVSMSFIHRSPAKVWASHQAVAFGARDRRLFDRQWAADGLRMFAAAGAVPVDVVAYRDLPVLFPPASDADGESPTSQDYLVGDEPWKAKAKTRRIDIDVAEESAPIDARDYPAGAEVGRRLGYDVIGAPSRMTTAYLRAAVSARLTPRFRQTLNGLRRPGRFAR